MAGLGSSMQSLRTAWYADVLYGQELYRLNRFPYFKPHIPSLDSQASTSFSFPGYFWLILILFLSIATTMGRSVRLARSILLDEPKETYSRPRADTMLRTLCRGLSGSPT